MSNASAIATLTGKQTAVIARTIKADLQGMDADIHNASVRALRIGLGLILVRDLGAHGDLERFKRDHFDKKYFRTLENYIRIGDACLKDTGLRDPKTRLLHNGDVNGAVQNLMVSTGSKGAAAQKVLAWIGERGPFEILQDVRNTAAASAPPANETAARVSRRDQQRAAMWESFQTFRKSFGAKHWMYLEEPQLTEMSNTLNKAQLAVGELLRKAKRGGDKS